jgi:hypothetical protein
MQRAVMGRISGKPTKPTMIPKSSIHPFRLLNNSESFARNLKDLKAHYGDKKIAELGSPKPGQGAAICQSFPLSPTVSRARNFEELQTLLSGNVHTFQDLYDFLMFWECSRQIFAFDSNLASALANTGIEEMPWSELRLPHHDFYVSWGDFGQDSYNYGGLNYIIDGAYVRQVPEGSLMTPAGSLNIRFTSRLVNADFDQARTVVGAIGNVGYNYAEPTYRYTIQPVEGGTVGQAMAAGEELFLTHCRHMDETNLDQSKQLAVHFKLATQGQIVPTEVEKARYLRGKSFFEPFIPTLLNCILYLTEFPANVANDYPTEAPQGIVARLRKVKGPAICSQLNRELKQKGYSVVRFVKDATFDVPASQGGAAGVGQGRKKRVHWRRGHWRRQAYGEALSQHRTIWIKPVLVGVKEDEAEVVVPEAGTVHQVEA